MSLLNVNELLDNFYKYVEARIALIKFETKESITEAVIAVVRIVALLILSLFVAVFASISLALFLNDVLDNPFAGFLIVTGIYLVLLIVAITMKDNQAVKARIMEAMFKEEVQKAAEDNATATSVGEETSPPRAGASAL
jgi:uncharacterized membrane protein YbhN (UPF0104 family)